ncbi:MAG: hypothetical protein IJ593_04620 [Lachnospiraceae bacterium]|nr:hypothetical protein [Lachnospiraceae bacterium]
MRNLFKKRFLISFIIGVVVFTQFVFADALDDKEKDTISLNSVNIGSDSNIDTEKANYLSKSKPIRDSIITYTNRIKELNEYINKVNNSCKQIEEKYKTDKNIIPAETMRQIRELKRTIKSEEPKEKNILEEESIDSLVQNREYNKALNKLNNILDTKKEQLKTVEEKLETWKKIDNLIE